MAEHGAYFGEQWPVFQEPRLFRPIPNPTFRNPTFESAGFRALIVRLSPFRDVVRSAPHLFLFQAVRRALPEAYVDFAFLPPQHDRDRWLAAGVPLLIGAQSTHDIADFDIVLVSNAYTLELINLPYLFHHSRVPLLASQRDDAWPPVVLGGSNAMASQAAITPGGDSIADAIFFGEGERLVGTLVRGLREGRGAPKRERLIALADQLDGLWVANGPADQQVTEAICQAPSAEDLIVDYPSLNSEEASTARLQINFGCPAFCTFCFEGYDRKPYREVAADEILKAADRLKVTQGVEAVDVYSFNFNTHEEILSLLLELNRRFDRVNLTSQRADLLAMAPTLVQAEVMADKRSFTVGIEGISARMRALLHKSLTDTEIAAVLTGLMQEKIREIKLFYILTGHEDTADLSEFHSFIADVRAWRQQHARGLRVVFSFGLLVRMPFTPLRYDRLFLEEQHWRGIVGQAKSSVETQGFEFRLATPWEDYAASQVLALAGSWISQPVLELAKEGHVFDGALSPGYWPALRSWLVAHGRWNEDFLGEKGPDATSPLSFVSPSVSPEMLYRQYQQALAGVDEGYCLGEVGAPGSAGGPGHCLGCGACTTAAERVAILEHAMQHPGPGYLQALEETMQRKWRLQPVYVRVRLPVLVAGAEPAWINAFVLRSLVAAHPELAPNLLSVREAVFATKANARHYTGWYGQTVVALKAWDVPALAAILEDGGDLPSGIDLLGVLADYRPGTFLQARLRISLPARHFPEAGRRLRAYLQQQYVPVNLRRVEEGYVLDVPAKARKKRVLLAGSFVDREDTVDLDLVVTPKFDLVAYLSSFTQPGRYRGALVEIRELLL